MYVHNLYIEFNLSLTYRMAKQGHRVQIEINW